MLDELQRVTFAECVNTEFRLVDENLPEYCLKLSEVIDRAQTPRQEAFSLIFLGPAEHFLPQGTHKLDHPKLGPLEIFLVPIGQLTGGFQYEAVFNRLLPEA